jgi:hypothetical protein
MGFALVRAVYRAHATPSGSCVASIFPYSHATNPAGVPSRSQETDEPGPGGAVLASPLAAARVYRNLAPIPRVNRRVSELVASRMPARAAGVSRLPRRSGLAPTEPTRDARHVLWGVSSSRRNALEPGWSGRPAFRPGLDRHSIDHSTWTCRGPSTRLAMPSCAHSANRPKQRSDPKAAH